MIVMLHDAGDGCPDGYTREQTSATGSSCVPRPAFYSSGPCPTTHALIDAGSVKSQCIIKAAGDMCPVGYDWQQVGRQVGACVPQTKFYSNYPCPITHVATKDSAGKAMCTAKSSFGALQIQADASLLLAKMRTQDKQAETKQFVFDQTKVDTLPGDTSTTNVDAGTKATVTTTECPDGYTLVDECIGPNAPKVCRPIGDRTVATAPCGTAPTPSTPATPFYKKWYFWAIVGAVAAGGVGVYVYTRKR